MFINCEDHQPGSEYLKLKGKSAKKTTPEELKIKKRRNLHIINIVEHDTIKKNDCNSVNSLSICVICCTFGI